MTQSRRPTLTRAARAGAVLAVAVLVTSCQSAAPDMPAPSATAQQQPPTGQLPLLRTAGGGDGDSWKDTAGREYRLGMVNAPEYDECYGAAATAKRQEMTAAGFRARIYQHDRYGRSVSVVTTAGGVNLNVWLARYGYVDDRYLAKLRHENTRLASQLDAAFAAAKREGAGLWAACR